MICCFSRYFGWKLWFYLKRRYCHAQNFARLGRHFLRAMFCFLFLVQISMSAIISSKQFLCCSTIIPTAHILKACFLLSELWKNCFYSFFKRFFFIRCPFHMYLKKICTTFNVHDFLMCNSMRDLRDFFCVREYLRLRYFMFLCSW